MSATNHELTQRQMEGQQEKERMKTHKLWHWSDSAGVPEEIKAKKSPHYSHWYGSDGVVYGNDEVFLTERDVWEARRKLLERQKRDAIKSAKITKHEARKADARAAYEAEYARNVDKSFLDFTEKYENWKTKQSGETT